MYVVILHTTVILHVALVRFLDSYTLLIIPKSTVKGLHHENNTVLLQKYEDLKLHSAAYPMKVFDLTFRWWKKSFEWN